MGDIKGRKQKEGAFLSIYDVLVSAFKGGGKGTCLGFRADGLLKEEANFRWMHNLLRASIPLTAVGQCY